MLAGRRLTLSGRQLADGPRFANPRSNGSNVPLTSDFDKAFHFNKSFQSVFRMDYEDNNFKLTEKNCTGMHHILFTA